MLLGLYMASQDDLKLIIGQITVKNTLNGDSAALATLWTAPDGPGTPMDFTHVPNTRFLKKYQLHGAWGASWGLLGRKMPQIEA